MLLSLIRYLLPFCQRELYINSSKKIVKIATDTTTWVEPTVEFSKSNQSYTFSPDIAKQYSYIMANCPEPKPYGVIFNGSCATKKSLATKDYLSVFKNISTLERIF